MLFELFVLMRIILVLLGIYAVITQLILPAIRGTPMFPWFNTNQRTKEELEYQLKEVQTEQEIQKLEEKIEKEKQKLNKKPKQNEQDNH